VEAPAMSSTLLRLGLYTVILTLVLFVLSSTFEDSKFGEMITSPLLQGLFIVSGLLIVAGVVMRVFSKAGVRTVSSKNRCRVCQTPIPQGAIYCRPHLRGMLEREDRKTHSTRIR
jgi:predicted nucleic acid-binding Zn ribbon protein